MEFSKLMELDTPAVFIAEAGINHDGNIDTALEMVDIASDASADYVKFQSFVPEKLVIPNSTTSSYIDQGSRHDEDFRGLLRRLQLNEEQILAIKERCREKNIGFLSTAFDSNSFDFLVDAGMDLVKIASGDLTNLPFLSHVASSGLPIILSTGMATLGEIEEAVNTISREGNDQLALLHCISWYPAKVTTVNLRYIETLRLAFCVPVGYSDHTLGTAAAVAARALGAVILEKHFTIDSTAFGPDHAASIEPPVLRSLIRDIRDVEKCLGISKRQFCDEEISQRLVHRRSIVATQDIDMGEKLSSDNLSLKRPGGGIQPREWDSVLGKSTVRKISKDSLLQWSDIST